MCTFFVPSLLGYGGETYWGWMPFTDFPLYMGILVLFLAVFTLVIATRERLHVYLAVLGLLSLVVAFGRHVPVFYDLLFNYFPYFDKFRVPVMITVLLQFSVAVLAAIGLDRILKGFPGMDLAVVRRRFLVVSGVFVGVVLVLGLWASSGMMDASVEGRIAERLAGRGASPTQLASYSQGIAQAVGEKAQEDFVRVLVILVVGILVLYRRLQGKLSNLLTVSIILLLTVVDLWVVDRVPLNYDERGSDPAALAPTAAVMDLQAEEELFRSSP